MNLRDKIKAEIGILEDLEGVNFWNYLEFFKEEMGFEDEEINESFSLFGTLNNLNITPSSLMNTGVKILDFLNRKSKYLMDFLRNNNISKEDILINAINFASAQDKIKFLKDKLLQSNLIDQNFVDNLEYLSDGTLRTYRDIKSRVDKVNAETYRSNKKVNEEETRKFLSIDRYYNGNDNFKKSTFISSPKRNDINLKLGVWKQNLFPDKIGITPQWTALQFYRWYEGVEVSFLEQLAQNYCNTLPLIKELHQDLSQEKNIDRRQNLLHYKNLWENSIEKVLISLKQDQPERKTKLEAINRKIKEINHILSDIVFLTSMYKNKSKQLIN